MIKLSMRYNINDNRTTVKIRKNTIKKEELNKLVLYPGFKRVKETLGSKNYIVVFNGNMKKCEENINIMFDKKDNE